MLRALAFFARCGIEPKRLQTDDPWIYTKNAALAALLKGRGVRHHTIPPRTPKRNGKDGSTASGSSVALRRRPTPGHTLNSRSSCRIRSVSAPSSTSSRWRSAMYPWAPVAAAK